MTVDCIWGPGSEVLAATDVKADEFKKRLIEVLKR